MCREGEAFGKGRLKEAIYEACEKRSDPQSEQVRLRMAGVLTDLHAADVRYHVDCKASFMCLRQSSINTSTDQLVDSAFNSIIEYVATNKSLLFTTLLILHSRYVQEGGNVLSRRQLIKKY